MPCRERWQSCTATEAGLLSRSRCLVPQALSRLFRSFALNSEALLEQSVARELSGIYSTCVDSPLSLSVAVRLLESASVAEVPLIGESHHLTHFFCISASATSAATPLSC